MPSNFDSASKQYDEVFTFSNIGKAQRQRVYNYINPIIGSSKKLNILEVNCGTGEDAILFGGLGHDVIATDISEEMIAVANAKEHPKNVIFKIQDINTLSLGLFDINFDLVFSNFGGLNCLSKEQLSIFIKESSKILNPKGKLVLVIMPKKCLWERFYFSLKGNYKKAKRRNTSENIIVNVDGTNVKTWYYNPKDIVSLSEALYKTKKIKPIGLAIPPSYLENSFLAKSPLLYILKGIDRIVNGSFWAKYADHFLIELEKK
ncbi:methylase [Gaetbulibacter sp. 4G1]|nr:class I SAM-dependent methyltransferase [Gaetbulibacter sp. 4G1]PIA79388.1 methylase [Gaetbulibacter sp. 4G1]